jgi:hypothetical protein
MTHTIEGEDRRLTVISWQAFGGLVNQAMLERIDELPDAGVLAQPNESRPRPVRRLLRSRKRRGDKNRRPPGSRA